MITGIYTIINTVNGEVYVGQSTNVSRRLTHHKSRLKYDVHINSHLQSAFNEYGADAFEFALLWECDKRFLDDQERYWINMLDACGHGGYNLEFGGAYQKQVSDETRSKISSFQRGRSKSSEMRKRLSDANKGRKHTDETRHKLSEMRRGQPKSDEWKQKLSQIMKGRKMSEADKQKHRGKVFSSEHRRKLSDANRRRVWTPEMRHNNSIAQKRRSPASRGKQREIVTEMAKNRKRDSLGRFTKEPGEEAHS